MPVDLLFTGTVPAGSGLSSSAAMVVASTLAFLACNNKLVGIKKGELVELAVENERRVGVNSGGYVPPSSFKRKHTHTPLEWTKPHLSSPSPSPPSSSTSSHS